MTLVDDETAVDASNKEFITLTTRDGNFFYLIIDRDKDGNNNVHFLNQVDEEDLLSLMDDETAAKVSKELETKQTDTADTSASVSESSVSSVSEVPVVSEKTEKKSGAGKAAAAGIALAGGAGAAAYVFLKAGKKKKGGQEADPDDAYEEDYVQPEETEKSEDADDPDGYPDDEEKE